MHKNKGEEEEKKIGEQEKKRKILSHGICNRVRDGERRTSSDKNRM